MSKPIGHSTTPAQPCELCLKLPGCMEPRLRAPWAHEKCIQAIEPTEMELFRKIEVLFFRELFDTKLHIAHYEAIKAVKEKCAPMSIIKYLNANGEKATAGLFNTVGYEAARKYALSE